MQNELKCVRQGQDETARMVRESQIESARISAKGKKPAYTFKKKGNEIQSAFIDKGDGTGGFGISADGESDGSGRERGSPSG